MEKPAEVHVREGVSMRACATRPYPETPKPRRLRNMPEIRIGTLIRSNGIFLNYRVLESLGTLNPKP